MAEIVFHKNTFFELKTGRHIIFIDPVFSSERRGRRVPEELRSCDYVLATSMTPWFDDVLDLMDKCEATFLGSRQLCRTISQELDIPRNRTIDLAPWERASEEGLKVTAYPLSGSIGVESAISNSAGLASEMSSILPLNRLPLVGSTIPMVEDALLGSVRQGLGMFQRPRALDRVTDLVGIDPMPIKQGLGWYFEIDKLPSILHMADGIHMGTNEDTLEEIAETATPDILIAHVSGMDVGPLVRAVRIFQPTTVLLYRSSDPYASGRRSKTLPIKAFIQAVEEGAKSVEVLHIDKGDAFLLDAEEPNT